MSDTEENFVYFGKPLDTYDEDAFPKKKPISVEEQIATDTEGRRRFHGAFTGGFSAGFFNTVGSLEGWTPSEFKSTRQEKAKSVLQNPEDFMDAEDFGEYGIAHQSVRATNEFSTANKRKRKIFIEGPIPGQPVLETLLTSGNETIGYLLLKNIGIQDKIIQQQEEINSAQAKIYGCQMPTDYKIPPKVENKQYKVPTIYREFLGKPKFNTFGLGYEGLDKTTINLFQTSSLVVKDKSNKKLSISGQAFGVGAFEDEDEDIYMKEDMNKYDFELTNENKSNKQELKSSNLLFGVYKHSKVPLICKKIYPPPNIPHSFTGKHKIRKSRFDPVDLEPINRKEMNPAIRAKYLGENVNETYTESKPVVALEKKKPMETVDENPSPINFDISSILISDRFVSESQKDNINNVLEPVQHYESHGSKELREAARMKMFGPLTRFTTDWHPCSILCKRFNVPEPFLDRPEEKNKKRTKNLIFEYQKHEEIEGITNPGLLIQTKEDAKSSNVEIEKLSSKIDVDCKSESVIEYKETASETSIEAGKLETESSSKDIIEKVDVADKLDLFKAVFLSNSESEEDEEDTREENNETQRTEKHKIDVLSDQLIPRIMPLKEGILSNVNFHAFSMPKKNLEQVTANSDQNKYEDPPALHNSVCITEEQVNLYGPKLPAKKVDITQISNVSVASSDSDDEWVEVNDHNKKKKTKNRKKHKREKHKKHKYDKKKKEK